MIIVIILQNLINFTLNINIFLGLINTFVEIRFHISTSQTNGMETIKRRYVFDVADGI